MLKILEIRQKPFCRCIRDEALLAYTRTGLEQSLNQGDITIKQFQRRMENIGKKAAEQCYEELGTDIDLL